METKNTRRMLYLIGAAAIAMAAGIGTSWLISNPARTNPAPQLQSATPLLDQGRPLLDFSLQDHNGKPFGNAQLADRWSFLFFGYTHCPDICPTTMATLNAAMQTIAGNGDAENTQVVFVSVDPERDDVQQLSQYVPYFNKDFIGVTGQTEEIDRFTSYLGILHAKSPNPNDPDNYLVDHGVSVLLIDPRGLLVAVFGAPHHANRIAGDFHELRLYYEKG